ncbi:YidB family protein [Rivibacter subsaxonicus]|uniref:Uncharacterized protein YidB (DUF937 family) n=1 Tax=Rivibacter subsaxonicus TaxID=457575 RepID=A0A4Q7VVR4_9BURK|nr:YidB family protein [Rivibacter subsaxonicus]RZU00683.1 uncharacterized protein YidB (DUF937 family) [Rivibacter subsaxonicus]
MGLLESVIGALAGGNQGGSGAQGGDMLQAVLGMLLQGGAAGGGGQAGGMGGAAGMGAGLGGLGALVQQFQQGGLGDLMASWVGTGQNLPISAEQLQGVLGSEQVGAFAQQFGLSHEDAAHQLSQLMPQVVSQLTPDGELPSADSLGDIGSLLDRFGQR